MPRTRELTRSGQAGAKLRGVICKYLAQTGKPANATTLKTQFQCKSDTTARKLYNDPSQMTIAQLLNVMDSYRIPAEEIVGAIAARR